MIGRICAKIIGKVQGVAYRAHCQESAQSFKLHGHVENRPDGSVELCAQGEKNAIEQLLLWCQKGSPKAKVEKIYVRWEKPNRDLNQDVVFTTA